MKGKPGTAKLPAESMEKKERRAIPMDKNILNQYIDACELIRETEQEIKKLNRKQKDSDTDKRIWKQPQISL